MAAKKAPVEPTRVVKQLSGAKRARLRGSIYLNESAIDETFEVPLTIASSYSYVDVEIARANFVNGKFYNLSLMIDLAMQDGKILSLFRQRTSTIAGLYDDRDQVHIDPATDDPFAVEVANWWKRNLWTMITSANLRDFVRDHAVHGYHPAQVVKNDNDDLYHITRWTPALIQYQLAQHNFFAVTAGKSVTNPTNREIYEAMKPNGNKWLLCTAQSDLYRCWIYGCAYNLITLWAMKQFAFADWQNFVKAWCNPKSVIEQTQNLSASDKALLQAANAALLQGKNRITLPAGCKLNIVGAAASQGSQTAGEFIEAINLELSNMILGMSTDHSGGAYDSTRVLFEGVAMGTTREDLSSVNNSFFPAAVKAITNRFFGMSALAPRIWIDSKSLQYNVQSGKGGPDGGGARQPTSPSSDAEKAPTQSAEPEHPIVAAMKEKTQS